MAVSSLLRTRAQLLHTRAAAASAHGIAAGTFLQVDGFKEDMTALMESPRDLWALMCMWFARPYPCSELVVLFVPFDGAVLFDSCCAAFTYNTMANVMTVFATAEYGFDDIETGEIYGYWGLMSSLWAMVLGPLIDVLGCRKTGIIGFTIYVRACQRAAVLA